MIECLFRRLCWIKNYTISGFWKFSRNCLAGLQSRQAAHTTFCNSGFLEKEPSGGIYPAARRHKAMHHISGLGWSAWR